MMYVGCRIRRDPACSYVRSLALLLIGLVLSSCAMPYAKPVVETVGESSVSKFKGILDYAQEDDLQVVWLHGMCTHDYEWAENRHTLFADAIGVPRGGQIEKRDLTSPYTVSYRHLVNGNNLELKYLVWSPLAARAKASIADHFSLEGEHTTARFNYKLKRELINDCFSDAVVYSGAAGDGIRAWVKSEICQAIAGQIVGDRCQIAPGASRKRTIFVAESLGSKILSDAVISIWEPKSGRSAVERQLSDVQMVFYLANQIPLLSIATPRDPGLASLGASPDVQDSLMKVLSASRTENSLQAAVAANLDKLHFVAFTDPNDLLSYRLKKGDYIPDGVAVTNITVSNDYTYLGLLERPDTAHCGYGWNPAVIGTVVNGYDGTFHPISIDVPKECGLGG